MASLLHFKIMMNWNTRIHILALLLLTLVSLVSCEQSPDAFYQDDLAYTDAQDVYLSLEDSPDGQGQAIRSSTIKCHQAIELFAILRNKNDKQFLASMEVQWEVQATKPYSSQDALLKYQFNKNGSYAIKASYNQQFALEATLNFSVADCASLPVPAYEHFDFSQLEMENGDDIPSIAGQVRQMELKAISGAAKFYNDQFAYAEFDGDSILQSTELMGITGNSERTVVAVAMPYNFGRELYPYHNPVYPAPTMLGFGQKTSLRSVYDFNFYGNGEFFANFYGSTQGFDDTYNYQSPKAELSTIQIFSSRYQYVPNQYYGLNTTYLNGEIGNQVWTRLQTTDGTLSLGHGAFRHSTYTEGYQGRIYEVIIFNRALSDQEMTTIHQFLKQKYQL